jgi:hypothetical protein
MNNQLQQQRQQSLHPDWRLASEKFANDSTFGNGREESLRSGEIRTLGLWAAASHGSTSLTTFCICQLKIKIKIKI